MILIVSMQKDLKLKQRLPLLQSNNFSKCVIWGTGWEFFYYIEELCSVLKILKFLYFKRSHDLPNLLCHNEY